VARSISAAAEDAASTDTARLAQLAKRGASLLAVIACCIDVLRVIYGLTHANSNSLAQFLARRAAELGLHKLASDDDPILRESDEAFRHELRGLVWVPVLPDAPRAGIPWGTPRRALAAPSNVRLEADVMLVSYAVLSLLALLVQKHKY